MPPPDLLTRISTPFPDHHYPIHSPPPSLPLSRPSLAGRLSIFDKRWPALLRSETSNNPLGPQHSLDSDNLVYPATEAHSASVSPDPEPSMAADTELLARLRDCIASFDSTAALQQPKILNSIVLLEQDLQNIADQSSSDLDTARRAEALAQNSLITAKEAVALAQENVSVALAAKDRVDQALIRLAQLRSQCESETSTATGEQALMHNLESVYQVISRQAKDGVPGPPMGLSRDALSTTVAELTRKIESPHGSRKRKRCQNHHDLAADSDLPYPPSKEPRIEQHVFPSVGPSVECLAEAARVAWNQEAERRSVIPPDAVSRSISGQQGQKLIAESHASDAQQMEVDIPMQSVQGPASGHPPAASSEQDPLPPPEPNISEQGASFVAGPDETEDPLQGQRRRELEEQKREITKFQMRERELQESRAQRKDTEIKKVVTLGDPNKSKDGLIPPAVLRTSHSAPNEGHSAIQRKMGVSDDFRKAEQRLVMDKQRAPMAKRSGSTQIATITQPPAPQSLIQKSTYEKDGQSAGERRQQIQNSLQQLSDVEHGEERKIPDEASMNAARVERAKFKEQINDGGSKQSQRTTTMSPNVGNVVAQQTLTGSPRGKTARSPQVLATATRLSLAQVSSPTSPTQGIKPPPRSPFQPTFLPLQPPNRENAPRNSRRQNSVPPIECIDESSGDPVPSMKHAAASSPLAQAHDTSLPKATMGISVSEEAQSANVKFTPNSIMTGYKALPPVSITLVPKAERLSPTITNAPIIQPPLPQGGVHSAFTAPQQNVAKETPLHPLSAVAMNPQDISQLRNESHQATANSGSNAPPFTSTLPSRARMDLARDTQPANNECTNRQSNSPPPPLFMAGQPNIPSSSHAYRSDARPSRGWAYGSPPPRHTGARRPRHRGVLEDDDDDDDERHWSPPRDRDRRIPRNGAHNPRTPSGSPPHESTPTYSDRPLLSLSQRIEGAYDPALQTGSEPHRPFHPVDPADRHVQEWSSYAPQMTLRRPPFNRFSNRRGDRGDLRGQQPHRRPTIGRQGRGVLRLEERIT
ncbi:hypothetical protein APHAL10511_003649 [Amanita phalloides]|nr:hypothetical protein APHAL10511_003649 [Amanita phalloides]